MGLADVVKGKFRDELDRQRIPFKIAGLRRRDTDANHLGVALIEDRVVRIDRNAWEELSVAEVTDAIVEASGPKRLARRSRVGPVGMLAHRDGRQLYLTISSADTVWSIQLDPRHGPRAREFAARVLAAVRRAC